MIILDFENAVTSFLWSLATVQFLTVVGIILVKSKRTLIAVLSDIFSLLIIGYFTASQFTYMQANFPTQLLFVGILSLLLVLLFIRDIRNYVKEIKHNQPTIE